MVAYKETAEEQLLKMIEGPAGPSGAGSLPPQGPSAPSSGSGFPAKPLRDLARNFRDRLRQAFSPPRGRLESGDPLLWTLRLTGRILWAVLVLLGLYVVADLVVFRPVYRWSAESSGTAAAPAVDMENPLKPLADYLGVILMRDPFTGAVPGVPQTSVKTSQHKLEELAKGLVLVGIDRGPHPAALVENTEQKKTVVLNVGDEIQGMKVKKITQEGVVLAYEGEEYVLR